MIKFYILNIVVIFYVLFYQNEANELFVQVIEGKIEEASDPMNFLHRYFYKAKVITESFNPVNILKNYVSEEIDYKINKIPVVSTFEDIYDFIIIGSGPGGSVMATRLSEIGDWKILLLEAGVLQDDMITDIPLLAGAMIGSPYDWSYQIEKQQRCCQSTGGNCMYPRGKALGGTSVIHGMMYVRGNKENFNQWQRLGNDGWSYDDILKYFKKAEDMRIVELQDSVYHNVGGYGTLEYSGVNSSITESLLEAGIELGYYPSDNNGANQTGFAKLQGVLKDGRRCSAAKAYLRSASNRKNLSIATGAFVTKIIIDPAKKQATGVEFTMSGKTYFVKSEKEVILSAGAISSPQILMLSGIGPTDDLQNLEIPVIHHAEVGAALHDHLALVDLTFDIDGHHSADFEVFLSNKYVDEYFKQGTGPLTIPGGIVVLGSVKTSLAETDIPDVEIIFMISNLNPNSRKTKQDDAFHAVVMIFDPKSVGSVKLRSADPGVHPIINPNCFSDPRDTKVMVEGIKLVSRTTCGKIGIVFLC